MQLLKALIGGLVGGVLGAGAHLWLEVSFGRTLPWALLLAGLGAGLGVRLLTAAHGRSLLAGIVAALMAFVGVITTSTTSSYLATKAASQPIDSSALSTAPSDDIEEEEEEEDLPVEEVAPVRSLPKAMANDAAGRYSKKSSWGATDITINSLSALIAFVLGLGRTKKEELVAESSAASSPPEGDAGSEDDAS